MTYELHETINETALLQGFIETTGDMIKRLHELAISLETNTENLELVDELFRICHTIKGNASFFALMNVKQTAHSLEDLLGAARTRDVPVNERLVGLLWSGINILGKQFEAASSGHEAAGESAQSFIDNVRLFLNELRPAETPPQTGTALRESDTIKYMCGRHDISRPVYILNSIIVKFKQQSFDPGLPGKFGEATDMLKKVFMEEKASGAQSVLDQMVTSYEMMVDDDGKPNEFLADVLMQHWERLVSQLEQVPVVKEQPSAAQVQQRVVFIEPSVRIEEKNIDLLLASAKKLDQLGNSFFSLREQLSNVELPPEVQNDLRTAVSSLSFLCQDIFQTIVKLKLVSPEPFLEKSRKMITALAETCGKKVDISFSCKNLMVERKNLELLEGVFIHLMRNAIDHGIELPEERLAAGKPEAGRIVIELSEDAQKFIVSISDDGRGVDIDAVRRNAVEKGKIEKDQAANLNDEQVLELLLMPGFSTSKAVTEFSGRGVGMDAVANTIRSAGGSVAISSKMGTGMSITLSLPSGLSSVR